MGRAVARGASVASPDQAPASAFFEQSGANAILALDGTVTAANERWLAIAAPLLDAQRLDTRRTNPTPNRVDPAVWTPLATQLTPETPTQYRYIADYGGSDHRLRFQIISARDGTVSEVACIAEDTADLQVARQAAHDAKARNDDIARLVSDWLWECDAELKLSFATPRVSTYLGVHPVELYGRHFLDLGSFAKHLDYDEPAGYLPQEFTTHAPFRDLLYRVTPKSGLARLFRLSAVPLFDTASGDFTGYRGTARDITELHMRETALIGAKEEAELANRAKTEFLANMSHELRTPLNAIIGFSEIISAQLFGDIANPRYVHYAGDIHDSAGHLLEIINDILDVSRAEAGRLDLVEEPVDLHHVVAAAIRLAGERSTKGDVTVTPEIETVPVVIADERKLKQILHNLLSNAIKFTPSGGKVTVTARTTASGDVELSVRDTGIGMSEDQIATAMSPFGQVDSALNRAYEGTGLGLPLCSALVELHGGTLTLTSVPEHGTTAAVRLPASRVRPNS